MKKEVAQEINSVLSKKNIKLNLKEIENLIEIPKNPELGDYAFPCFVLSKQLRKSPDLIAKDLEKKINKTKVFSEVKSVAGYLNFFVNKNDFAQKVIYNVLKQKKRYGYSKSHKKKSIMIEFSQPNTHKAFHVGHIRGTSIGESLSRIHEFFGDKVIRANYSGDTGMHIAKWIWCYNKYHKNEKLKNSEQWIASIYVDAVKRLKENKEYQEEVNEINRLIDKKLNNSINNLWKKTRKLSIDSWKEIYKELNTHFDVHYFESNLESKAKKLSNKLVKNKIAKIDNGAVIVDLKKYGLDIWVVLRSDGTVLYSAKDLALAYKKLEDFPKINSSIVLIAHEQDFYFKQLEKVLELMKFKKADNYNHLFFGMVRLPSGKMSSRTGENILYSDFIKEVKDFSKKRIIQKSGKINKKELEKRAEILSIASIKYSMLKQSPNKNIVFKKEDALNFEGNTGPYILYTYARANSILRKAKLKTSEKINIKDIEKIENELLKKIQNFSEVVQNAYKNLNPSLIANYSYELAQLFNEFYHSCPVIGSENEEFRISLIKCFKQVLENSLNLLGIETLEEM
ncbi:MAG: arginine--tRNA ligase [Nanoarchaeota archaeon]